MNSGTLPFPNIKGLGPWGLGWFRAQAQRAAKTLNTNPAPSSLSTAVVVSLEAVQGFPGIGRTPSIGGRVGDAFSEVTQTNIILKP